MILSRASRVLPTLLAALACFAAAPAQAAFPGSNGDIAFERSEFNAALGRATSDIWVKTPWGQNETNLTEISLSNEIDPAWAPSGDEIAISSDRDGDLDIYVMETDGSIGRQVTNAPGDQTHPAWSPDGTTIAFETSNPDGGTGIWSANADGTEVQPMLPVDAGDPAWSPDGTRLAFIRSRNLHLLNFGTGNVVQLYDIRSNDPDWAPDSSEIAFNTLNRDFSTDEDEIYAIRPDGTGLRNVSNHFNADVDADREPAWSPDGTLIVAKRNYFYVRCFDGWLSIMDANGSGKEVTFENGHSRPDCQGEDVSEFDPSWQPRESSFVPAYARHYARPGSASPVNVPLVPAYRNCATPNARHAPPLDLQSCSPPAQGSPLVTISNAGRGRGKLRMQTVAGNPGTATDEADVNVNVVATDVLCATGQAPGCPGPVADYSGQLLLRIGVRLTDRANPFDGVTGTVWDNLRFELPLDCTPTPGAAGSICKSSSSLDAILPGTLKEGARSVMSLFSIEVLDAGADGSLDTHTATPCPPRCGSGDENPFLVQGVFTP